MLQIGAKYTEIHNNETYIVEIIGINNLLYNCVCEVRKNGKFVRIKTVPIYEAIENLRKLY